MAFNDIRDNRNHRLFGYGIMARIKELFGGMLIWGGLLFAGVIGYSFQSLIVFWIILILSVCLGFFIIYQAKAQRFDFQKQSGNIIHKGYWN